MKKIYTLIAVALLASAGIQAQTIYDGALLSQHDLNGTARYVGMGGAMGALGGDISTISSNPAGIGVFRKSEASVSMGLSYYGTEAKLQGMSWNQDKNRFDFNQIGVVLTTKVGDYTPMRYLNFGLNYQRVKSFYRNMKTQGELGDYSQAWVMANMHNGFYGDDDVYPTGDKPWLADLGYAGYLINPVGNGKYEPIYTGGRGEFESQERGGLDRFDFNMSMNLNDRVYLGLTVGAYWVDYSKYVNYSEIYGENPDYGGFEQYNLKTYSGLNGAGIDLKLGIIVRPMEYSPLKLGFAIHTPTFFKLDYKTHAVLQSDIVNYGENEDLGIGELGLYEVSTDNLKETFQMRTPWTFQLSAGYTIGSQVALGAVYEYKDYSTIQFQDESGYADTYGLENNDFKNMLKGVHTLRLGGEFKVIPQFALRAGYNYSTALFDSNKAFKNLPYFSPATDTDFNNKQEQHDFTLGVGYRGRQFYIDLAYKYTTYKSDFYLFDTWNEDLQTMGIPTKTKDTRSQAILTLGYRF